MQSQYCELQKMWQIESKQRNNSQTLVEIQAEPNKINSADWYHSEYRCRRQGGFDPEAAVLSTAFLCPVVMQRADLTAQRSLQCGMSFCSSISFFLKIPWTTLSPELLTSFSLGDLENLQQPLTPAEVRDCQHIWDVLSDKKDNLASVCKSRADLP